MLAELSVSDLGVIEHLSLVLGPGMTVVTGETGAGKTLIVGALELLLGGRADSTLVRPGATEARVDARFVVDGDDEVVLSRVVPVDGRSRAYIDGRPVPLALLTERGRAFVDLHGQHAHQSLLRGSAQRDALDTFGNIDTGAVRAARTRLRDIDTQLSTLGGDARSRARELDLLRFQVNELDKAAIEDEHEDERLDEAEAVLADATAHRDAGAGAVDAIAGEDGVRDGLSGALTALGHRRPFADLAARMRSLLSELDDVAEELRAAVDRIDDDPDRLADVRMRRQLLRDLCRKYGEDLGAVLAYAEEARQRLHELETHDERAAALDEARKDVLAALAAAESALRARREAAAPALARAIESRLHDLAMGRARVGIELGEAADGSDVSIVLAANAGGPLLPLSKVASGGELARTMLALRLTLLGLDQPELGKSSTTGGTTAAPAGSSDSEDVTDPAPTTLIFDEVDAGIGGTAAVAVGNALAALGAERQVLVVTHLPQVAACAASQVLVAKHDDGTSTRTTARLLGKDERVVELSRMLSGQPDSATARRHARELLQDVNRKGKRA